MNDLKQITSKAHHCIQGRVWYDARLECGHVVTVTKSKQKRALCRLCTPAPRERVRRGVSNRKELARKIISQVQGLAPSEPTEQREILRAALLELAVMHGMYISITIKPDG